MRKGETGRQEVRLPAIEDVGGRKGEMQI